MPAWRRRPFGVALLALIGCGPPPATVVRAVPKPRPRVQAPVAPPSAAPIDLWRYTRPLPARAGDWLGDALGGFLIEHRPSDAVLPTRPMACVARELGHYLLATGHLKDTRFHRGMAAACGATRQRVTVQVEQLDGAEGLDTEGVLERWQDALSTTVAALPPRPSQVGAWIALDGDTAWFILASAERTALVPPFERTIKADRLTLRGRATVDIANLDAIVTHGARTVKRCTVDRRLRLPAFAVTCPLATDDPTARVDVVGLPRGRILGIPLIEVEVWPTAQPRGWIPFEVLDAPPDGASPEDGLLALVNTIRSKAGHAPLTKDRAQSAWVEQILPAYRAALDDDPTKAEEIAAELMAGHAVKGLVRRARFVALRLSVISANAMVSELLGGPSGRWAMLDPLARRVALAMYQEGDDQWLLAATYRLLDEATVADAVAADRDALGVRLERLRGPKAKPVEMRPIAGLKDGEVLEAFEIEGRTGDLGTLGAEALERPVRTLVIQTHRIEEMTLPDALVQADVLAVSVAYTRDSAFPWAKTVYFIAVP